MNSTPCHECNTSITRNDPVVSCSAFCNRSIRYHAVCVGLSVQEGLACLNKSIFWVCHRCRNEFESRCSRIHMQDHEKPDKNELKCIKHEMKKMQILMNTIVQRIESFDTSPRTPPSTVEQTDESDHPVAESSRVQTSSVVSPKMFSSAATDRELDKLLFISNIANDVSDDEVKEMIINTLGKDDIISLKCLVSPWKEKSSLEFVSYKLVINSKRWNPSPQAYNWPKGVRCREFKERSNETWRPLSHVN